MRCHLGTLQFPCSKDVSSLKLSAAKTQVPGQGGRRAYIPGRPYRGLCLPCRPSSDQRGGLLGPEEPPRRGSLLLIRVPCGLRFSGVGRGRKMTRGRFGDDETDWTPFFMSSLGMTDAAGGTSAMDPCSHTPDRCRLPSDGRDRYTVQLCATLQSGSAPRRDDGWRWRNPIRRRFWTS